MRRVAHIALLLALLPALSPALVAEETHEHGEADEPRYRCSAGLDTCLNWMAKHFSKRGWAGMQLDVDGLIYTVTEVHVGSPAATGGVRPGDVLIAVNGVEFTEDNKEKLIEIQQEMVPGAQFTYTIKRKGKRRNLDFVLVEMPIGVVARMIGMHLLTDHVDLDLAFNRESD